MPLIKNYAAYNYVQHEHDNNSNMSNAATFLEQEVKTEIKVEPDFYPPMNQTDCQRSVNDYNPEDFSSNQTLSFLHDFQDNVSNSTNSSYTNAASNEMMGDDEDAVCCVKYCGVAKRTSPSLHFFPFPRDDKYMQQWLHNLKMPYDPQINYTQYRICSLHFPKRCMNRYSLSYWAVPTFNLGHEEVGNLYQNREVSNNLLGGDGVYCSMPGCGAKRDQTNVKFYNFPKDLKTLIKWCQNARLPVHTKESRHFCSRHFEEKCFGKFRLKPWAIPTLNLGTIYGKIHDNPNISYLEEKKCCLPFCRKSRSDDFNLSLYRFPRDETLLRKWCYNLRLHPDVYRGKNHKICSHHFMKEALGLRKLSPGAVPTLNLGHHDRINIYNSELYKSSKMMSLCQRTSISRSKSSTSVASSLTAAIRKAQFLKFQNASRSVTVSTSSIYDEVLSSNGNQKFSSSPSSSTSNAIDLSDVCLVPSCKRTRHSENITLHTVPRRLEQLEKWCHNLKMNLNGLHKTARICSAHFENYCIGGCMRPFAVPTLELGHNDSDIYRNPDVIKKLNIRETCCVPICKRNRDRDHANLHRFPTNPEFLQKWCANLEKPIPDGTKLFNDAVCEVHFEEKCLRNKRLEKWAIPTLKLGYEPVPYALPSEEEITELWSKPITPNNGDETGECCVITCKRNPEADDVKLYRPPEDAEQLVKWSHNLQIDVTQLSALKICNLHFESHCIGKRLLSWAMPTLNLASKVEHLFENPPPTISHYRRRVKLESKRKRERGDLIKWSPRCCLTHCRKMRSRDHVQLFRFPVNMNTMSKWCHNLQLPVTGGSHRRICSAHFEPSVLTKRCPIAAAVPTLNLNTPPGYKIYQNSPRLKQQKIFNQHRCVVTTCRKTRKDGVQLFRFPHNRIILAKWRYNLKNLPKGKLSSQFRICSLHFEKHSIGLKRLSLGAVPTLILGHDSEDIYPNETRSFFEADKCVVTGCSSSKDDDNIRLFRFPREDENLLRKWCHNLKMNPNDCVGIKICNLHFEADCLSPKSLYKWSIPTMRLGYENDEDIPEIIHNPSPEKRCRDLLFKCCLPTCGKSRKYDEAQMNSFPKNLKMFRRWKHNLKLEFLDFREREKYKICNDHFEAICLGKTRLNFGAIPTINLGHDIIDGLYKVNPLKIRPNLFVKQSEYEKKEIVETYYLNENEYQVEQMADEVEEYDREMNLKCSYNECKGPKSLMREPYDLPQSEKLQILWSSFINVDQSNISSDSKLCGLHFQQIFEQTSEQMRDLSYHHDDVALDFEKLEYFYKKSEISLVVKSSKCSVTGCTKTVLESQVKLYQFPNGKELIEKWCQNTNIKPDEHRRYLTKVCCFHFEEYCFTSNQRLRSWAVPTLNLNCSLHIHKNPDLTKSDRRLIGPPILKCCVRNCIQESHDNIEPCKLFSFPLENDLLQKWCVNLKVPKEITPLLKICNQHFEKYCFGSTRIRSWAIPTIKLGHNENIVYHNQETINEEVFELKDNQIAPLGLKQVKIKRSLDSMKCFIPSCRRSRLQHGVRFFGFPSDIALRQKWCHNLQMPSTFGKYLSIRICSVHFHKKCLDGKNLRHWAVPTLHLGHNESIYDNPRIERRQYALKCIVPHCGEQKSNNKSLRFFSFPKNSQILEKWCNNLRIPLEQCRSRRICEKHFEIEVLEEDKLKMGCVPTLNLGHSESLEYNNLMLIDDFQENYSDTTYANEFEDIDCMHPELDEDDNFDYDTESLRTPISWSNLESRELRVNIIPLKQEDLTDITSISSSMNRDRDENGSIHSGYESRDDASIATKSLHKAKVINNFNAICCLKHCGNVKTPEQHLTTFGFPKDSELLQKWCDNLDLEPSECVGRVCIDHFELRVMGCRRLKPGAIPTLNLGHNRTLIHSNEPDKMQIENNECKIVDCDNELLCNAEPKLIPPPYKSPSSKQSVFRLCCLKHCRRKRALKNYHQHMMPIVYKFPQNPRLLKKWAEALKMPIDHCTRPNLRLCADHFKTSCFKDKTRYKLKGNSVPSLNLNEDIQKQDELDEKCCLNHCLNTTNSEKNLFLLSFPLKPQVLIRKWCYNTRMSHKIEELKSLKICNQHFEKDVFFKGRILRINALPTINLGHMGKIYRKPKFYQKNTIVLTSLMKCCVKSCQEESEKLYGFPKSSELQRIWSNNMGIETHLALKQQFKLCKKHFTDDSFLSACDDTLKLEAIPTLYLDVDKSKYLALNNSHCVIQSCGCIPSVDRVKLYPFPQEDGILEKWLYNLQLPKNYSIENAYVCSRHFDKMYIESGELHKCAVPTIFLGHTGWFYKNTNDNFSVTCSVTHCKYDPNDDNNTHINDLRIMYKFPKDEQLLRKWLDNLKMTEEIFQSEKNRSICSEHFEEICMVSGKDTLLPNSLPTLNLGYNPNDVPHSNTYENCCFDTCKLREKYSLMAFHKFPQNQNIRELWLNELNVKDNLSANQFLCSAHFLAVYERVKENHEVLTKQYPEYETLTLLYKTLKRSGILQSFKCAIAKCSTGFKLTIKLFKFPIHNNLFNKWQHNTGLQFDMTQRNYYQICALHFESRCLSEMKLHRWAVPTLGLPTSDSLYANPPEVLPSDHEYLQHCCVSVCNNSIQGPFFQFPFKSINLKKWLYNLDLDMQQCTTNLRVCYKHFEKFCFNKHENQSLTLKPWSMPTLHLPLTPKRDLFQNPLDKVNYFVCSVPGCHQIRNSANGIYFYGFPKSESLARNWLMNVGIKHEEYRDDMRICSRHFELDCFVKDSMLLRKHTVPTLNLCTPDYLLHKNPIRKKFLVKNITKNYCIVKTCTANREILQDLPNDITKLKKLWHKLQLGNFQMDVLKDNTIKICKYHYNLENFNKNGQMSFKAITNVNEACVKNQNDLEKNIPIIKTENVDGRNIKQEQSSTKSLHDPKRFKNFNHTLNPLNVEENDIKDVIVKGKQCKNLIYNKYQQNEKKDLQTNLIKSELEYCSNIGYDDKTNTMKRTLFINDNKFLPNVSSTSITQICCVRNCDSKQKDSPVQFKEFPSQISIYKKWLHNLRIRHSTIVRKYYRVCWQHFEAICCGKNGLKIGSVPTLNLGHNYSDNYPSLDECNNKLPIQNEKPKYHIKKCSYPECRSNKAKLYDLPPFSKLCEKWWHIMKLYSSNDRNQAKICDIHFYMLYHKCINIIEMIKIEQSMKYAQLNELYTSIAVRAKVLRHRCIITNCDTDYLIKPNLHIKLYNFPTDYDQAKKWCYNCDINYDKCIKGDRDHNYKVCALHFEAYCINIDFKLYHWAIPTLHLNVSHHDIYLNDTADVFSSTGCCCIKNCINENGLKSNTRYYPFPTQKRLLNEWLSDESIDLKKLNFNDLRICGGHFAKKFIRKDKTLMENAIPNFQLNTINANLLMLNTVPANQKNKEENKEDEIDAAITVKQEIETNWDDWYNNDNNNQILENKLENMPLRSSLQYNIITVKEEIIDDADDDVDASYISSNEQQMPSTSITTNDNININDNDNDDNDDDDDNDRPFINNVQDMINKPQIVACYSQNLPFNNDFIKEEYIDDDDLYYNTEDINIKEFHTNVATMTTPLTTNEIKNENNTADYEHMKLSKMITADTNNLQLLENVEKNITKEDAIQSHDFSSYPNPSNENEVNNLNDHNVNLSLNKKVNVNNDLNKMAMQIIEINTPTLVATNDLNSIYKLHILTCCVVSCLNSTQTPQMKLYTEFPSDSDLFIKWCFNLKIDPRHYREHLYAVCSSHFDDICFKKNHQLQAWAVPTLNLGLPNHSFIHQYDLPNNFKSYVTNAITTLTTIPATATTATLATTLSTSAISNVSCIVWGCHEPQMPFYQFPLDPEQSRKWFFNLQLEYTEFRAQTYRICRKHFDNTFIDHNGQLLQYALPTLALNNHNNHNNTIKCLQQNQYFAEDETLRAPFPKASQALQMQMQDIEDHDSSYYEDFEEYFQQNEQEKIK